MGLKRLLFIGLLAVSCGQPEVIGTDKHVSGSDFFKQRCAECHGLDGKACISDATDLSKSTLEDAEIKEVIENGRNGMPPFGIQIKDDKTVEELVELVKTLRE